MDTEVRSFRYHDEARRLGEELAEIKVAEPKSKLPAVPAEGALDRIARGDTAFGAMPADRAAVLASIPQDAKKNEVKQKLQTLLAKKQGKVAEFIADAEKLANPSLPDVSLNALTSGSDSSVDNEATAGRHEGIHQGPAANLIAAGLKNLKAPQKTGASGLHSK